MAADSDVSVRPMVLDDIPAGLRLCRASGWNQTEHDWRYFLTAAPDGALVAIDNGVVVGTVATLPYGPFAWISMVLVDPEARRKGVGTMLLNRGLTLLPPDAVARLDATPAGELVYRKLGFAAEYGLARLFLDKPASTSQQPAARLLTHEDWPVIREMDLHAFGASRADLLERLAAEAPEYAWVIEQNGRLQGYVLGRHGHLRDQIGPLIADSTETAERLLDACLYAGSGQSIFVDVPDNQHSWRAALVERSFAVERPFLRMYRGRLTTPGETSHVYAITGPEFG